MQSVLLVSNVELDDTSGRGANLSSRAELLEDRGWETVVGRVHQPYVLSVLPAIVTCAWTAHREDVDVVTSINNPFHLHLIGFLVATLSGRPWIAEVRDPIAENPDRDPDAVTTRLARAVERLVARRADMIVWGDGIQMAEDYFQATYGVDDDRVQKLPFKGYAPSAFDPVEPATFDDDTITYAGSFYDGWIEPYTFFEGLGEYVDRHGADGLTVRFYGDWRQAYDDAVAAADVTDVVEYHSFVPKEDLIPVLKGSDALLYVGGDDPANRRNVPTKVYDYVGARRPMLVVSDPSFRVARLVREEGLGVTAPYRDPSAIADAIEDVLAYAYDPDSSTFERFHRSRKIEALADAYETVS